MYACIDPGGACLWMPDVSSSVDNRHGMHATHMLLRHDGYDDHDGDDEGSHCH